MFDISPSSRDHLPVPDAQTSRLLPTTIDEIASQNPDRIFAEYIYSATTPGALYKIDYLTLARAIDRTAWWLKDVLDPLRLPKFAVVAYKCYPDFRYYFFLVAAIKYGITIQFLSPSNDVESCVQLMKVANCSAFLQSPEQKTKELKQATGVPFLEIPELDYLFDPRPIEHFPYSRTYAEAARDPVLVFQTSGTTGFPKPLVWTNAHISLLGCGKSMPLAHGLPISEFHAPQKVGHRRFMTVTIYHASMVCGITCPVFTGVTAVFPPFHVFASAYTSEMLENVLTMANCETAMMLPNVMALAQENKKIQSLIFKLKEIFYIGAPLPYSIAQIFTPHVKLATLWGSTEVAYLISQETDPEDYEYLCLDDKKEGIFWNQLNPGENLYEMWYTRLDEHSQDYGELVHPQYVFFTMPHLSEFRTGDVFSKHPYKPGHWKFVGRSDDHIILDSGINVNPHVFEARVEAHQRVKSAKMVGNSRPCVCLLLELHSELPGPELDDEIGALIQQASHGMRSFEKVPLSMIVIVSPKNPLPRSFKGAVKRKEAAELYSEEINACYASLG